MLQPARRKYRKEQKGRNTGIATRGSTVAFGDFGLKNFEIPDVSTWEFFFRLSFIMTNNF